MQKIIKPREKTQARTKIKKQKRAKDIRRFAAIVGVIVGSFLLVTSVLARIIYVQPAVAESRHRTVAGQQTNATHVSLPQQERSSGGFIANLLLPPEKTNFMIAGLDAGDMLADVILVGSFDRETQEITVISIPRDTRWTMPKEDIKALNELGRYPPSHGVMKMNAVSAHGGKNHGMEFLKKQLERLLDIEINYYAQVDLRAFKNIVDAVGGVYMEIPGNGLYYDDPEQNLRIRVPGGHQLLDGEKAEGVVRFRATYRQGDLQRIGVQQEFMKQFFAQVINKDAVMKNLGPFLTTVISYVRTDFGLIDIPLYLRYATSLSAEKITFLTLPGHSPAFNDGEASYFYFDPELTAQLVQEIFYNNSENIEVDEENDEGAFEESGSEASGSSEPAASGSLPINSARTSLDGLRVQMLNGGTSAENFESLTQKLEEAGADVIEKGSYTGARRSGTRILVHKPDTSEKLSSYFSNITGEVNAGLSQRFDAVIIVGNAEL